MRHSGEKTLLGRATKQLQMWMMEIEPQHAENTLPREDSDSRIYATVPGRTIIEAVESSVQFYSIEVIPIEERK